jgi:hypothetical protein
VVLGFGGGKQNCSKKIAMCPRDLPSCSGPRPPTKKCPLAGGAQFRTADLMLHTQLYQPSELCYAVLMVEQSTYNLIYPARFYHSG